MILSHAPAPGRPGRWAQGLSNSVSARAAVRVVEVHCALGAARPALRPQVLVPRDAVAMCRARGPGCSHVAQERL